MILFLQLYHDAQATSMKCTKEASTFRGMLSLLRLMFRGDGSTDQYLFSRILGVRAARPRSYHSVQESLGQYQ